MTPSAAEPVSARHRRLAETGVSVLVPSEHDPAARQAGFWRNLFNMLRARARIYLSGLFDDPIALFPRIVQVILERGKTAGVAAHHHVAYLVAKLRR